MVRLCGLLSLVCFIASAHADGNVDPVAGRWSGTLGSLHLVLTIVRGSDGAYAGQLDSIDQHATLEVTKITRRDAVLRFEVPRVGGVYEGTLKGASALEGTWTQTGVPPAPLVLSRQQPGKAAASGAPAPRPLDAPVEVTIPSPPTVMRAGGKNHLVYELHVTSFSSRPYALVRVEVLDGERALLRRESLALAGDVQRAGVEASGLDRLEIGPGQRSIVFMWVTLDGAPPKILAHRLTVGPKDGGFELTVRAPSVSVQPATLVVGPPFRGARWSAANGPSNTSGHRRAVLPVGGRAHIGQRFAIDWVQLGADQKTFAGPEKENRSYHAWGQEALAVADGTVVEVKDGIPENVPGSRAVEITLDNIGGNHVTMEIGKGRYAFYAHLQPGKLKVKVGDKVKRGQALGLIGNSGNSSEPHLHFHIGDDVSPLGAEGQPYAYDAFELEVDGRRVLRQRELPVEGQLVAFP